MLVIGAGLAGATAARELANAGRRVQVLDKGRGPGGRLSTRRTASGSFDHGAASLQAVGAEFRAWLDGLAAVDATARWADDQWVGVPGMNAVVSHLLEGLAPRWSSAVAALRYADAHWHALDASGGLLGSAPRLVLAIPAPQAHALLATLDAGTDDVTSTVAELSTALAAGRYAPCWAAMVTTAPDAANVRDLAPFRPDDGVLERVVPESGKPGRSPGHWVLHARTDWSERHLEGSADDVSSLLLDAFVAASGITRAQVLSVTAHRWRYATPTVGVAHDGLSGLGLHLAGDVVRWRSEAGIPLAEHAWRSGRAAAQAILGGADQPKS